MKLKGADDAFCKSQIIEYLRKYGSGTRTEFGDMLLEKLPDILTMSQKENKIKNILQALKHEKRIEVTSKRTWRLAVRRDLDECLHSGRLQGAGYPPRCILNQLSASYSDT